MFLSDNYTVHFNSDNISEKLGLTFDMNLNYDKENDDRTCSSNFIFMIMTHNSILN